MKLLVRVVIVLMVLVVLVIVGTATVGWSLTRAKRTAPPVHLTVAPDSSLRERGEHLVTVMCAGCHGRSYGFPLEGNGENFLQIPKGPNFGRMYPPNLTPGGKIARYTDDELARAIREGVNREGYPLLVMPSKSFHRLSDRDVAAIISVIRSQPSRPNTYPTRHVNFLGLLILGSHTFELSNTPPITGPVADVPVAATPEYGEYMISALDCRTCHGPGLTGGKKGQLPPVGPNLVALAAAHDVTALGRAIRDGIAASDGHALDPTLMPYAQFKTLGDVEIAAIHARLRAAE